MGRTGWIMLAAGQRHALDEILIIAPSNIHWYRGCLAHAHWTQSLLIGFGEKGEKFGGRFCKFPVAYCEASHNDSPLVSPSLTEWRVFYYLKYDQ
ncbi:hypothetical protein D3C80_1631870 [compost metagenome]